MSLFEGACLLLRYGWWAETDAERSRPSESVLVGRIMLNSDRT